ncbi:lysylphosphatidylglycerol synthase transmembrane domain-containing protein [Winogradskya humida]|uniref:Lysylphosphatidylglycerol synthase-like protein n=1 Tax=Winogradskya humida TaxID=113566 RepID=A0ABQ4A0Z2_9ACTN|nr:YbhN family protein [Actinoplanes humidus]GIE24293.1 hypothetical protein Ahu01nite_073950 [Actinoplanes humidus]
MVNGQLLTPGRDEEPSLAPPRPPRSPWGGRKLWISLAMLAVATGAALISLRGHLPSAAETWSALRGADPLWLIVAVALHSTSLVAFAEQERRLLSAFGVTMPLRRAIAITVTRSAMTMALPGGSAVAAAYGFRQFRERGANAAVAGAVTALCGVTSVAGLALLYAGEALIHAGPAFAAAAAVAATALLILAGRLKGTRPTTPANSSPVVSITGACSPPPAAGSDEPTTTAGKLRRLIRQTATLAAAVPPRRWLTVLTLAILNWLGDLLCLLVCLRAVGLHLPFPAIAAAFLGAQLARQIPFTAGGIGVIEAGLVVTLTTLGGPPPAATAAVLTYRALTCWLILPLGATSWAALRARSI